jgi:predicted 2-oxoglutarate/Fe(II)-dependent dioxygenase YbiX
MIVKHLGNGIMLFDDVLEIGGLWIKEYVSTVFDEFSDATNGLDSNTSTNDGGYMVEPEHASKLPIRFHGLSDGSESVKNTTAMIDAGMYRCLVEYCRSFPVAIDCIKWKTSGQIASYSAGQYIGPHSDCALPYDENGNILNSFPLHNTLTGSMILSDGYEGGEINFKPWGITISPKIGSVLIYPSSFMGCHEVMPVTAGRRDVYLQWYCQGRTEMSIKKENELNNLHIDAKSFGQKYVHVGIVDSN